MHIGESRPETHAPRNLESRETQRSICLPDLPRVRTPIDFRDATGKDRRRIGRARRIQRDKQPRDGSR
jgi:hypothetical protein